MRSPVTIPNRKPNEIRYGQIAHITRIDMFQSKSGLIVATFAEGWTASTPAFKRMVRTDITMEEAVALLRENGWTVFCWYNGARAWLGPVLPVRTAGQIKRLHDQYRKHPDKNLNMVAIDFALDLDG
jgi:hypothetical protein